MIFLFRLNKDVPGFEDQEQTKLFFENKLPKINKGIFDPFKSTGVKLQKGAIIYFAYRSHIVAKAIFVERVKHQNEKYNDFQLNNIKVINSSLKLNNKIVSSRTRYINTDELQQEINRVLA